MSYRYAQLRGLADVAQLRTAMFNGDEHLVVPVVMLVGNSVVWPMNADTPEFVPAEELSINPASWNGRPCVPDHPNNGQASANTPETLEVMGFGQVFNTKFEDLKLKGEAWLSKSKAAKLGGDCQRVIDRCQNREMVEISVGAWISAIEQKGIHNGQPYSYVWTDIVPDHLALLPEGVKGACSIEMGCGAPRVNAGNVIYGTGDNTMEKDKSKTSRPRLTNSKVKVSKDVSGSGNIEIVLSPFTMPKPSTLSSSDLPSRLLMDSLNRTSRYLQDEDGVSDVDLRDALWAALRATVPGFDWIVEVFPDTSTVIYTAIPEQELVWYRQTYVMGASGDVTLNDDQEQVEPVTRYEPVAAREHGKPTISSQADHTCTCKKGDGNMSVKDRKSLIDKLIRANRSPFKEEDVKSLESFTDDRLLELVNEYEEGAGNGNSAGSTGSGNVSGSTSTSTDPAKATTTPVSADATTTTTTTTPTTTPSSSPSTELTEDQWLAQAPESLRRLVGRFKAEDSERRAALIAALKSSQSVYSEARLNEMTTEQLQEIAALAKVDQPPSYLTKGLPIPPTAARNTDESYKDPWGITELQANRRGSKIKSASTN